MSIINDALKKASDKRNDFIKLQGERLPQKAPTLEEILPKERIAPRLRRDSYAGRIKRIESRKVRWNLLSSIGTIFIVALVVSLFLYNKDLVFPHISSKFQPFFIPAKPTKAEFPSLSLNGIIEGKGRPMAIVNNRVLGIGDSIDGAVLTSVSPDTVTLLYNNTEISLTIQ